MHHWTQKYRVIVANPVARNFLVPFVCVAVSESDDVAVNADQRRLKHTHLQERNATGKTGRLQIQLVFREFIYQL